MTTLTEFRAGDVRGEFRDALHALSSSRSRRLQKRHSAEAALCRSGTPLDDDGVHGVEVAIGDMAVEATRFDLQTGYAEYAVGRVVTPGCQIGYTEHTGCHQLVF